MYEGRSINKLQNGAIPSVLKVGKIRNIRFVGNLIMNIPTTFLDDDVIIVTSSGKRTQSICVLFSPSVYYRNSQVINSVRTTPLFHFLTTYRPSSFKHLSHLITSF